MQIKYLVDRVRSISGYKEKTSSRVNTNKFVINDNMIFSAINEAQKFICATVEPDAFNVPLMIDLESDILGGDLLRPKLSSFNEGSKVDYASSTILGSEKLPLPNSQKVCNVLGINQGISRGYGCYDDISYEVVYRQNDYLAGSSMGSIGRVMINKYKSETLQCDHLSTLKTSFIVRDKNEKIIDTYSITTETNVYSFDMNSIRVSVNYKTGLITFSYRGSDLNNYYIEALTLYQPNDILYFNKGKIRISNQGLAGRLGNISIRISPYSVWDPTQEICSIYDNDLIELLAYRSAIEVQRFNKSMDQNLVDIVYNKQTEYQNRERFKTFEDSNDIIYPSSY